MANVTVLPVSSTVRMRDLIDDPEIRAIAYPFPAAWAPEAGRDIRRTLCWREPDSNLVPLGRIGAPSQPGALSSGGSVDASSLRLSIDGRDVCAVRTW